MCWLNNNGVGQEDRLKGRIIGKNIEDSEDPRGEGCGGTVEDDQARGPNLSFD